MDFLSNMSGEMPEWTQTTPSMTWTTTNTIDNYNNNNNNNSNQSMDNFPTDCIILGLNATIPWDNPGNLVSHAVEGDIERVKSAIHSPLLFLVGFPCNVVNMVVFYKQGLKDRINMCLFALAVADLLSISFLFVLYAERVYTQFTDEERFPPSFRYIMNNNVIGLFGLTYGPPLLSAVIATERCYCVLFPLRAQRCVSTKALASVIVLTLSAVLFLRFAITWVYRAACFHEMAADRWSWQVSAVKQSALTKAALSTLDGVLYGFGISVGCPVVVFLTTVVTAVKLRQIVQWRRQASSAFAGGMSSKEVGLTKMLICLSVEFFVLSLPTVALRICPMFERELNAGSRYTNTHRVLIKLVELSSFVSSSINFFVYYSAGIKFRHTLHGMFARNTCSGRKSLDAGKVTADVFSYAVGNGNALRSSD